MIKFTIDWEQISNGYEFTADYLYDGCTNQKGYDFISWTLHCLQAGICNGFKSGSGHIKLVNGKDYPEYANSLFQCILASGESLPGMINMVKDRNLPGIGFYP